MTLDNKLDKKIEIKSLIQPKTKLDKVDPKEKEIKKKILSDAEKWLKKKQNFLKLSQITLTLDKYGDIFSDFDPRSYIERALSIDFLSEIRRASREKPNGVIELKMLIPKKVRNQKMKH